jgi:hypothetical protein
LSADEESIAAVLTATTRGGPAAPAQHWRALLGGEPSAALLRHARTIGETFRASGLRIELCPDAPGLAPSAAAG